MLKSLPTGSRRPTNDATDRLLTLIAAYKQAAAEAVKSLQATFGISDPLEAYHEKRIAKSGILDAHGIRGHYDFHGVGCRFKVNKKSVDVDFGPDGRHDGFDVWRLHWFVVENRDMDPIFKRSNSLERAFEKLVRSKTIVRPNWKSSPHLYYLASDVKD